MLSIIANLQSYLANLVPLDSLGNFEISQLKSLRYLTMNWGVGPYWVDSSLHKGVRLIRHFQQLDTLTLVVPLLAIIDHEDPLRFVTACVLAEFKSAKDCDQAWVVPELNVRY